MTFPSLLRFVCVLWLVGSTLFAANEPIVANTLPDLSLMRGGATTTLDVSNVFGLTGVTGPLVEFVFSGGHMFLELFPTTAPATVANFLRYTDNKVYDNTIIHRSEPGFVIQAGGYQCVTNLPHVTTYDPVPNEFSISNTAGTMAMAKVDGDLNSATSEWFVNLADNTGLDADNQKFTVFGRLIGNGLGFCQSIAALPRVDLFPGDPTNSEDPNNYDPFNTLPVFNYTSGTVFLSNLLLLETVRRVPLIKLDSTISGYLTLTATSSNPSVMVPTVTSNGLQLTSGSTSGQATITVTATDIYGQNVSTTFVGSALTPSYLVSLRASPSSYGSVRGGNTILAGSRITVKAIPRAHRRFRKWTENGRTISTRASYVFTVGSQRSLVAVFSR
ncbi:MAG: peptidylprolyl isomerase [Chthoniobacterales bacterium]